MWSAVSEKYRPFWTLQSSMDTCHSRSTQYKYEPENEHNRSSLSIEYYIWLDMLPCKKMFNPHSVYLLYGGLSSIRCFIIFLVSLASWRPGIHDPDAAAIKEHKTRFYFQMFSLVVKDKTSVRIRFYYYFIIKWFCPKTPIHQKNIIIHLSVSFFRS